MSNARSKTQAKKPETQAGNRRPPKIDHLVPTQWKPGQSGNPAGRPRGVKFLSEALRETLSTAAPDGIPWTEKVALALIERACMGDPTAFREIADRIEGRVSSRLEVQPNDSESAVERAIAEIQERRAARRALEEGRLIAEGADR